ncbi:hypothetical protein V492_05290, partial [Pseudogymnoascus sp. VKM F-4246]
MSDLPEHLRDQYGSQPQDDDSQYHIQQSYYQGQTGANYQQQTMNQPQGSGSRHSALNMGALAGALPDPNYGQAFAQQSPQRYQTLPPNAGMPYQLQQPFVQGPAGQSSRNQQASSQYPPQFQQQQFQGMYLQGPGGHIQPVQGGLPMNQQQYPGQVFAQQQQRPPGIQLQQQQQQQQNPQFYYQQAALFAGQNQMFPGGAFPLQHGSGQSSRRPSEQLGVGGSPDVGRRGSGAGPGANLPTTIRGPPRKPKQSGHALWVGNLPPGANVVDLKDHFAQDATEDILSVFLMSKSSCAFVNYKTEEACAAAMARFHDSRLKGVRLVCRLRRSAVGVPGGVPTGPAALVGTGARAEVSSGAGDAGGDVDGEEDEGGDSAQAVDEGAGAPAKDKYFIVKSLTVEDLEMSVRNGVWATQSHNEAALDKAYKTAESVYLIFSANKSGEYYGYARMTSPINQDPAAKIAFAAAQSASASADIPVTESGAAGAAGGAALNDPDQPTATITPASATAPRGRIIDDSARGTIFWEADGADSQADGETSGNSNGDGGNGSGDEESPSPPLAGFGAGGAAWGKPFSVEWESTRRVPFFRTRGLKNAWNAGREVKIARDGTEIETR